MVIVRSEQIMACRPTICFCELFFFFSTTILSFLYMVFGWFHALIAEFKIVIDGMAHKTWNTYIFPLEKFDIPWL